MSKHVVIDRDVLITPSGKHRPYARTLLACPQVEVVPLATTRCVRAADVVVVTADPLVADYYANSLFVETIFVCKKVAGAVLETMAVTNLRDVVTHVSR
jgi:hypothetical protein